MHTKEFPPRADFHALPAGAAKNSIAQGLPRQYGLQLLCLLLFGEALAIALFVHPRSAEYAGQLAYVEKLGVAVKYLIYFCTALMLAMIVRLPDLWRSLAAADTTRRRGKYVAAQLLCYGALWLVVGALIPNDLFALRLPVPGHEASWSGLLLLCITAALVSNLLAFASPAWWMALIRNELPAFLLAAGFTAGLYFITGIFQHTWDDFMSGPTIAVARFLLDAFHGDVYVDPATKELGIGRFVVLISSTCSGYEGMGMIVCFLAWYSMTFKEELKYPAALLLYPIALLAMWLFNCIRIAALIGIGYAISPDIAMQGFHSNAGWIYFLCVSVGLILIARRIPFFSGKPAVPLVGIDEQNVLLLPELALLIATLLTAAMSGGFVWLYPLRIAATCAVLLYFWKRFDLGRLAIHAVPVLTGIAVFFLWVKLVPGSADIDKEFTASLAGAPGIVAASWLTVRAIGATLVIPMAEELAFRGYLINLLSRKSGEGGKAPVVALLPLIVSSIVFGAMHSQWLAGILAGLAYGLARIWRGKVWDAIVAHAVTNGLLAAYVLLTHQWSYW